LKCVGHSSEWLENQEFVPEKDGYFRRRPHKHVTSFPVDGGDEKTEMQGSPLIFV